MKKLNKIDWFAICFLVVGLIVLFTFPFIEPYSGTGIIDEKKAANFGTFIGGYIGTIFLLISIFILIITLSSQRTATQIQQFESKLLDMIKLHRDNVDELILQNKTKRQIFIILRAEFQDIYEVVRKHYKEEDETNVEKANIAYLLLFFGLGESSTPMVKDLLKKYNEVIISNIIKDLNINRKKEGYKNLKYLRKFKLNGYYPFNGHQSRLGHYFRHLYQIIKYIDSQDFLTTDEKKFYGKIIRAQLSNHELAIFFYNSVSQLGKNWSKGENKNYIKYYEFLKNIPLEGFTFELNPRDFYDLNYEWEEIIDSKKEK